MGAKLNFGFKFQFLILAGIFFNHTTYSKLIVLSDFDDTLLESREHLQGTFSTPIILYRIDHRSSTLEAVPSGPRQIEVSPRDFHKMKRYLAQGNGQLGAIKRTTTLESGEKISPGYYYLRAPDSYAYFRQTPSEMRTPFLLRDFKSLALDKPETWQGMFWPHMVQWLSHPKTASSFGLLTARGHEAAEWEMFFKHLKKKGFIEHLPNFNLFHGITHFEYDAYSIEGNVSAKKAAVLESVALELGRIKLSDEDMRLHPDGKREGLFHYLIFADDSQENIDAALAVFVRMAQNKTVPVKFGVFNTGNRSELIKRREPAFSIVQPSGSLRPATEEEMNGEIHLMGIAAMGSPCEKSLETQAKAD